MKKAGIYIIKCSGNKKVYIGQSTNINSRFYQHKNDLKKNKHHSIYMQNSWNKYGENCFSFEIIEELSHRMSKEEMSKRELLWMNIFDSTNSNYGFNNALPIMKGVSHHTNRSRARLSQSMKQHHANRFYEKYPNGWKLINTNTSPISFIDFDDYYKFTDFIKENVNHNSNRGITHLNNLNSHKGFILVDQKLNGCELLDNIHTALCPPLPPLGYGSIGVKINDKTFTSKKKASDYLGISNGYFCRMIKNKSNLVYKDYKIQILI